MTFCTFHCFIATLYGSFECHVHVEMLHKYNKVRVEQSVLWVMFIAYATISTYAV